MIRIRFLPFRNDLSSIHILCHTYSPLLDGRPYPLGVGWLYFLHDPELYDILFGDMDTGEIIEKRILGGRLTRRERALLRKARRYWLGRELRSFVERKYAEFRSGWRRIEARVLGLLPSPTWRYTCFPHSRPTVVVEGQHTRVDILA